MKYKTETLTYGAYHNFLQGNIQKLLTTSKIHYNARITYNNIFPTFFVHTIIRQMSISYHGINVRNKLYPEVICASTANDMKNLELNLRQNLYSSWALI